MRKVIGICLLCDDAVIGIIEKLFCCSLLFAAKYCYGILMSKIILMKL